MRRTVVVAAPVVLLTWGLLSTTVRSKDVTPGMQATACPHCSAPIDARDTFCGQCGHRLSGGSSAQASARNAASAASLQEASVIVPPTRRVAIVALLLVNVVLLGGAALLGYRVAQRLGSSSTPRVLLEPPR